MAKLQTFHALLSIGADRRDAFERKDLLLRQLTDAQIPDYAFAGLQIDNDKNLIILAVTTSDKGALEDLLDLYFTDHKLIKGAPFEVPPAPEAPASDA